MKHNLTTGEYKVLQLKELGKPHSSNEFKLQWACADYLLGVRGHGKNMVKAARPFPWLQFNHPAAEGRDAGEGYKFKRLGVMAGMTDWQIWGPNAWHGLIELKVKGGVLSTPQQRVRSWAVEYGFPHVVCHSVHMVRDALIGWGHTCENMACIEPDYLSKDDKFELSDDFYKPTKGS